MIGGSISRGHPLSIDKCHTYVHSTLSCVVKTCTRNRIHINNEPHWGKHSISIATILRKLGTSVHHNPLVKSCFVWPIYVVLSLVESEEVWNTGIDLSDHNARIFRVLCFLLGNRCSIWIRNVLKEFKTSVLRSLVRTCSWNLLSCTNRLLNGLLQAK